MAVPLHNLHASHQGRVVDGGRALADAAASLLDGLPGDIGVAGGSSGRAGAVDQILDVFLFDLCGIPLLVKVLSNDKMFPRL